MKRTVGLQVVMLGSLWCMLALPASASVDISGDVTTNTVLGRYSPAADGIYIVVGDLTVRSGALLTVQAGVQLRFYPTIRMDVGTASGEPGRLVCQGTSGNPILFTPHDTHPLPGEWGPLVFHPASGPHTLDHTTFEYGGAADGQLVLDSAEATLTGCTIRYSGEEGVLVQGDGQVVLNGCSLAINYGAALLLLDSAGATLAGTSCTSNIGSGIAASSTGALSVSGGAFTGNFFGMALGPDLDPVTVSGCTLTGNSYCPLQLYAGQAAGVTDCTCAGGSHPYIVVHGGDVTRDGTWENHGVPYYIWPDDNAVEGTDGPDGVTTLTIAPGVVLEFFDLLRIGSAVDPDLPGALVAVGTVSEPIVFTAAESPPEPGSWGGLYFADHARDDLCRLEYCVVSYGGAEIAVGPSPAGNINCTASSPTIQNCEISYADGCGVEAGNAGAAPWVSGCTIHDCTEYPIRVRARNVPLPGMTTNTHFSNGQQAIRVVGEILTEDAHWPDPGLPYSIQGSLTVAGTSGGDGVTVLGLGAGVELAFSILTALNVGFSPSPGGLVAAGTAADPVVLTAATASPGYWNGLYFASDAVDGACLLEHTRIEYGGGYNRGTVTCAAASPLLRQCEIRYSGTSGVLALTAGADPRLEHCWIHDNEDAGVQASPGTVQMFGGEISANGGAGVAIEEQTAGDPVTVLESVSIHDNDGGFGVTVTGSASAPVIRNCLIEANNAATGYGVYVDGSALPVIGGAPEDANAFAGHLDEAVHNASAATCIDASYNYWGQAGGPDDAGPGADGCMDGGNSNPGAERVSEDVDYGDWIETAPTPTPVPTATPVPLVPATSGAGLGVLLAAASALLAAASRPGRR